MSIVSTFSKSVNSTETLAFSPGPLTVSRPICREMFVAMASIGSDRDAALQEGLPNRHLKRYWVGCLCEMSDRQRNSSDVMMISGRFLTVTEMEKRQKRERKRVRKRQRVSENVESIMLAGAGAVAGSLVKGLSGCGWN